MYDTESENSICSDNDEEDSITGKPPQTNNNDDDEPLIPIPLSARLYHRNSRLAQVCVMVCVALERTSYYGLLGNLAYFLTSKLEYSSARSIELVLVFSGLTWISCFVGGVLGKLFSS